MVTWSSRQARDKDAARIAAEAVEEQGRQLPTEKGPLVRCALIRHGTAEATLLTTFHHAIGDATSGTQLVYELIQTANAHCERPPADETANAPTEEPPAPSPAPSTEPLSRRLPRRYRGLSAVWLLLKQTVVQLWQCLRQGVPRREPTDNPVSADQRRDRFVSVPLTTDDTHALVNCAKQNATTVHGALCAAQLLALQAEFPQPRRVTLGLNSLVSLRNRFDPPVQMTPKVSLLTNIGRFPGRGEFGTLSLEGLHFFFALSSSGRIGSAACTYRDRLHWSFTYGDPAISPERAQRISERARTILRAACRGTQVRRRARHRPAGHVTVAWS